MQVKIFNVPVTSQGTDLTELNNFLGKHHIKGVEQKHVEEKGENYWSFCVKYDAAKTGAFSLANKNFIISAIVIVALVAMAGVLYYLFNYKNNNIKSN